MNQTEPAPPSQSWLVRLAHSVWLVPLLLLAEIAETTFLPYPYEAVFIALCLAARDRIWLFVLVTVIGSAIAAAIMYGLGAHFAEPMSVWLGIEDQLAGYIDRFREDGAGFILAGGTTPVPSYLINFSAGASGYPFWQFVALFSASRFVRFAVLGLLLYLFGDQIVAAWRACPKWIKRALTLILIVGLGYWFYASLLDAP